nr:amidohydrolase family protein [Anaerolineae bacterium]
MIVSIGGSPQPGDRVVDLFGHMIFPGLVNACDQLHLNAYPALAPSQTYSHAFEWYKKAQQHINGLDAAAGQNPISRLIAGGFWNLVSGVTFVAHLGKLPRATRRRNFPVDVLHRFGWVHSLYTGEDLAASYFSTPQDYPWLIRIAEGTGEVAADELHTLDKQGCLKDNTVVIHGVDLGPKEIAQMQKASASLIWCPSVNMHILGETRYHAELIQRMAIGSGPRLAGARSMLDEIRLAQMVAGLSAKQVVAMVTTQAAQILKVPAVGRLESGCQADFLVIKQTSADPFRDLVETKRAELRLVVSRGIPRIADHDLSYAFSASRTRCKQASIDGVPKLLLADHYRQLKNAKIALPGITLA